MKIENKKRGKKKLDRVKTKQTRIQRHIYYRSRNYYKGVILKIFTGAHRHAVVVRLQRVKLT